MVSIIDYCDSHQPFFRKFNLDWLDQYQLTESHDLEVLNDPRATILDRGGRIFIAEADGEPVGSAALMPGRNGELELAKFAVVPSSRGQGIGRMLMEKCMDAAKAMNARKIFLFSNHQLETALLLYEKFGFRRVELHSAPFVTADVRMELEL